MVNRLQVGGLLDREPVVEPVLDGGEDGGETSSTTFRPTTPRSSQFSYPGVLELVRGCEGSSQGLPGLYAEQY